MNKKELGSQVSDSLKHTSEELPAELVELSEEDLQQIVGGRLWKAIKDQARAKWNAIGETGSGLLKGELPRGKTAEDLLTPIEWGVLERLWRN